MYKLLIVDDEEKIRDGLKNYIDWGKFGVEVIDEAEDGDIALLKVEERRPDIILSDVGMPMMNGIDMAEIIKNKYPEVKIIFLSGYDDVNYLKGAFRVEAVDYIFKPLNLEDLSQVFTKVVNDLNEKARYKDIVNHMRAKLIESMPLLRERFFLSLIRGEYEVHEIVEKVHFLELPLLSSKTFYVMVASLDNELQVKEKEKQINSLAVINICTEVIRKHFEGYTFMNASNDFVILLMDVVDDNDNRINTISCEIRDKINEFLKISITIGLGKSVNDIMQIAFSYEMANEALSERFFLGNGQIISCNLSKRQEKVVPKLNQIETDKIMALVKAGDKEALLELIGKVINSISYGDAGEIKAFKNLCLTVVLYSLNALMDLEISIDDVEFLEYAIWENISKQQTIYDVKNVLIRYLKTICEKVIEFKSSHYSNVAAEIKDIIEKRYFENIAINDMANELYLSPNYICSIFKKDVGETINNYITKVRIHKAKELLKDRKNKLYDICFMVGYADPSYFTKLFKRYTGITPSQYREKVIK